MAQKTKNEWVHSLNTTNIVAIDYAESFYDTIYELSHKHSIGRIFEDFLEMSVCGFHRTNFVSMLKAVDVENERHYFKVIKRYEHKDLLKVSDLSGMWFGYCKEEPFNDFLGNFFTYFVSNGEHGQFFTPSQIVEFMVRSSFESAAKSNPENSIPLKVLDPACGSGRFLVRAGKDQPQNFYFGVDIDRKCALMTGLNLFVNGLKGEVVWGDTLLPELDRTWDCWRINTQGIGIYRVPVEYSYIFQTNQHKRAEKQSKSQKPKINVGTINLPSENRGKEQVKAVQGGMF